MKGLTEAQRAEIAAYVQARDEMLLACDVDRMRAYMEKWNPGITFSSREVAEIALHKARTGALTLPAEERAKSERWLAERGYGSFSDAALSKP